METNLSYITDYITGLALRFHLLIFLRSCYKSDNVLKREPAHKNSLSNLEKVDLFCKKIKGLISRNSMKIFLTWYFPVFLLLLEGRERGEDEAEGGDHHEQAGDYGHHLEWRGSLISWCDWMWLERQICTNYRVIQTRREDFTRKERLIQCRCFCL